MCLFWGTSSEIYPLQRDRYDALAASHPVHRVGQCLAPSPGSMGPEKRKWDGEDEGGEKKGKRTWYEPEKDRESRCFPYLLEINVVVGIVVLDLDSSEDESANRSPRRRRSAFSLSSTSQSSSSNRPRSQTDAPAPEYIINPTLLSHLPPTPVISIPREEDPARAVVLFKPVVWNAGAREEESPVDQEAPVEARDDDAMDIDS